MNVSPTTPASPEKIAISALKAAVNTSNDCVIITDHDLRVLFMNVRAKKMLKPASEAIGSPISDVIYFSSDHDGDPHGHIRSLISDLQPYESPRPLLARTASGGLLTVDVSILPTPGEVVWRIQTVSTQEEIKRQIILQASLLDHVTDSVVACDVNATITYWNRAAERLYGWTAEEAIGKNVYDLIIPPENRELAREGFRRWLDDEPRMGESTELRKDGTRFTSFTRIAVVRNAQGERIGFVGLGRDLTSEKEASDNLNRTISLLQATLQSTEEGVLAVDNNGKITAWNERFIQMWDIPRDVILTGSDESALAIALEKLTDPDSFIEKVRYLYSRPEEESFDSISFTDGRIFERSSKPQRVGGIPIGRVWSFRDVTSLYSTQEKLRDQKSLYESLLNAQSDMGEGLAIASPGKVHYVNEAITSITGYSEEEIYALNNILDVIHPDDRQTHAERLALRMRGEAVLSHYESRIVHRSGRILDVEFAIKRREVPHQDQLVILMRDITQRKEIERSLIASESRFRTVVDNLGEAIVITDKQDRILYLNSTLEELSGYSAAECIGQNGPKLMTLPVEHQFNEQRLSRRLEGLREQYEMLLRRKDGSLRWCSVNAVPYYNSDGEITGTVAAITDIHGQKQRALELQRAEERFRYMTLATQDAVYDWSIETDMIWWNESFVKLFGHPLETDHITLERWASWIHPEDYERITKGLAIALKSGKQVWSDEYRFQRVDGSYAHVVDRGYILHDEHQQPYRIIGAMMDVTDRRRAEDELRMAAANTSALIENTTDAILSVDRELKLITFNTSFYEVFRLHNKQAPYPGMSLDNYFKQNESEYWDDIFRRALDGEHFSIERTRSTDEVGERIFEMSFNPIVENDSVVGIAIFDKDITERKRMELQLIAAKEAAEEMSRLKSSFLANMSHEIRTPMTAILGFASIIRENSESEDLNEYANTIERSGTRLLATINGILDLAKIESNKVDVNLQHLRTQIEIEKAVKFFRPLAMNKGLEIEGIISCDCTILADEQYLGQVLNNLVGNAIKFTPSGKVSIGSRLDAATNTCAIRIEDTGVGISPDFLPYIFDEFKQESGGYDRSFEGTGLGLTITKRLCEMMDAAISVESTLGKGSVFTVYFPIVNEHTECCTTDGVSAGAYSLDETLPRSLPSVLLVEDAQDTATMVDIFVKGMCQLEVAASAEEALEKAKERQFDLVLMDINLGRGASGLDVTKQLRARPHYTTTPIIALTAYAMKGDRETAIAAGCSDYISKPFSRMDLADKLKEYLPS